MLFKSIVIVLTVLSIASMNPVACLGGEIVVRLTGKTDFPGDLSLKIKSIQLERLCFLGVGAKGKLDEKFLGSIENEGVPVERLAPVLYDVPGRPFGGRTMARPFFPEKWCITPENDFRFRVENFAWAEIEWYRYSWARFLSTAGTGGEKQANDQLS